MNTLLELITFTKATGYLISIGFVLAFVAFWQVVYGKGRGRIITIGVLLYIVVGVMIVLGSCLATGPR